MSVLGADLLDLEVVGRLRDDFELAQLESLLGTFDMTLCERLDRLHAVLTRSEVQGDAGGTTSPGSVTQLRELADRSVEQLRAQLLRTTPPTP